MSSFTIPYVQLGYPHLWEARPIMQQGRPIGEPRFSVNLVLPANPDPRIVEQIKGAIVAAWEAKWPDATKRPPLASLRVPFVWGDTAFPEDPNCRGRWVVLCAAKADSPPQVVEDLNGSGLYTQVVDRAKVYPGCEAHVNVGIYGYDMGPQNRGISAGLNGVILTGRPVNRFDSKPTVAQMASGIADFTPPPLPAGAYEAPPQQAPYQPQQAPQAPYQPQQAPAQAPQYQPQQAPQAPQQPQQPPAQAPQYQPLVASQTPPWDPNAWPQ